MDRREAPDEEVLELDPDLEVVAQILRARELVAQDGAGAVRPRLALHRDVAGEAGDFRLPRQVGQGAHVGHGCDVGVVRALPDVARREPGEARAVVEQPFEMSDRDQLGARLAVHVDELGEHEFHAPLLELGAELGRRGRCLDGHDGDIAALAGDRQWLASPNLRGLECAKCT
jgi:hypothetical protein